MFNTRRRNEAMESLKSSVIAYNDAFVELNDVFVTLQNRRHTAISQLSQDFYGYVSTLEALTRWLNKSYLRFDEATDLFHARERGFTPHAKAYARAIMNGSGGECSEMTSADLASRMILTESSIRIFSDHSSAQAASQLLEESGFGINWQDDGSELALGVARAVFSPAEVLSIGWSVVKTGFNVNRRNKELAEAAESASLVISQRIVMLQRAHRHVSAMIKSLDQQIRQVNEQLDHLRRCSGTNIRNFDKDSKMRVKALSKNILEVAKLLNTQVTMRRGLGAFFEDMRTWFNPHKNIYID